MTAIQVTTPCPICFAAIPAMATPAGAYDLTAALAAHIAADHSGAAQ